jgi:hypothetical protein
MIKRRKGLTAKQKKQLYIGAGVAAALIGTWLLAGDKIKSLFTKDSDAGGELTQLPAQDQILIPGGQGSSQQAAPEPSGIDINKKLRKGSKGEEVKRLQFIINYIAGYRGTSKYKTPGGYTVNFPIKTDGDFGNNSQAGAYFISPQFKDQGFITLDQARRKLAYIAGYYGKPFPSELVNTKNYKEYQNAFKGGQIDGSKNVDLDLPNVGLDLTNFPSPFN